MKAFDKKLIKETVNIAWPAVIESFFTAFVGLVDSYMVSGLGSNAVDNSAQVYGPFDVFCDKRFFVGTRGKKKRRAKKGRCEQDTCIGTFLYTAGGIGHFYVPCVLCK